MLLRHYPVHVVDEIMEFIDPINISTLVFKNDHGSDLKKEYIRLMKKNIIQEKRAMDWNPVEGVNFYLNKKIYLRCANFFLQAYLDYDCKILDRTMFLNKLSKHYKFINSRGGVFLVNHENTYFDNKLYSFWRKIMGKKNINFYQYNFEYKNNDRRVLYSPTHPKGKKKYSYNENFFNQIPDPQHIYTKKDYLTHFLPMLLSINSIDKYPKYMSYKLEKKFSIKIMKITNQERFYDSEYTSEMEKDIPNN